MVELVDTYALGAYAVMRVGSSPTIPTKIGLVCILDIYIDTWVAPDW